jgi:glycerol-3-phosphate dehydrogenase (NAD(P)+)
MKKNKKSKVLVVGAGSWGTTLAVLLADKEYDVLLWTHREEVCREISSTRRNNKYTKDLILPGNINPFHKINDRMFSGFEIIILAVPSHALRETVKKFYSAFNSIADSVRCVLNVAKGFETGTNLRLSEVLEEVLPDPIKSKTCSLSGPNIAQEVARKLPSVSVVASRNTGLLKFIQNVLSTDNFRIYTNEDVSGVEIGGAIKNIIAIASGISDGLGYGANTKASLITRGLYELSKFGIKLGADPVTFSGAAVMGDLIATCISEHSRNRSVGERLANGENIDQIMNSMYMVAEGIRTTKAVYEIAIKNNLDVPITECIYEIIYKNLSPEGSVKKLMSRKFKPEIEDLI